MPLSYVPGRFKDLYETDRGRALWEFVTERDTITRMMTASDLSRPAVAVLGTRDFFVKTFGHEVTGDRWKQLIGHMVRQVMEAGPFELAVQGLKVGGDTIFSKGSRYRRRLPHWGHVYVQGERPGKTLHGDLGADSAEVALEQVRAFLMECLHSELIKARIEVRERGEPPSRKPSKTLSFKIEAENIGPVIAGLRRPLLAGKLAPNIDVDIKIMSATSESAYQE
jgi:hypothetical protein